MEHVCRFRERAVWSDWTRHGPLRERTARRIPICDECGREQPARRPRPSILREEEAEAAERLSLLDDAGRMVAEVLLLRARDGAAALPAQGLLGRLAARGVAGSLAETWLERLMRGGLVRLCRNEAGGRELRAATVLDPPGLEELSRPGERTARTQAIAAARASLEELDHPVAAEVRRVLAEEASTLSPDLAAALAAIARHAALGEELAERVFSVRHLGSSKALERQRPAVERRLGPLSTLGIREGGGLTLVGGSGQLEAPGAVLDLAALKPYLGLSRETALALKRVEPPPSGLVAVENFAVFEACCRGEVPDLSGALFVWTAGYPGRGVRALLEAAARAGSVARAWCDLDLDGVRIARIVAGWSPGCGFYRMSADELTASSRRQKLGDRARRAIERELATGPDDALTQALYAMLEVNGWLEQEAMLGEG